MLIDELKDALRGRVVVVGVGDASRGDDAVGPMIAGMLADAGVENVIDAGASPEIETWRIRELAPEMVLFIDAVDFGGAPGDAALLAPDVLRSKGFDTHRAPLKLTMGYLENELGCTCRLLAVQPRDVRQGAPMCAEVSRSAENLAKMILPRCFGNLVPETNRTYRE
ncbi:MAG: hydrogenase maturation protease [Armatimonadetes bacterium]|nr:hydrogenase maturation protease [Armatimonadota bacterium]